MFTIEEEKNLYGVVERLLESGSRINEALSNKYWYPLSMATYGAEEIVEALRSMCAFRTTMWEKTAEFEKRFAAYQGCADAVMVNSGSSADLLLAFLMADRNSPLAGAGKEILVPVVTWPTHVWSLMMAGYKVRFVDIDTQTLNFNLDDLEAQINANTAGIFLVHLMGNPCDMDRVLALVKKHNLVLMEDACEALGSEWDGKKVGNFGAGGSFSFFFSHHLTTMEGGMITVNDRDVADRLRILRAHGWLRNVQGASSAHKQDGLDARYTFVNWGFNVRPTELQAGFGLHQLDKIGMFNERRKALAKRFFGFIQDTPFLQPPLVSSAKADPCWFALPLMVASDAPFTRETITSYLEEKGIETRPIVAGNLARHPVANMFPEFKERSFPGADEIHNRGFYVGLSPMATDASMERLIECFADFLRNHA